MDRRKSLKLLVGGTATGAFIASCKTDDKKTAAASTQPTDAINRMAEEKEHE